MATGGRADPTRTALRYVAMLRLLPHGKRISAQELRRCLIEQGFRATERTIQRDLRRLADPKSPFPIQSDEAKPAGWSWISERARLQMLGTLNPEIALALVRLESLALSALPATLLADFRSWFEAAHATLARGGEHAAIARELRRKIRVVAPEVERRPSLPQPTVISTLREALDEERVAEVEYHGEQPDAPKVKRLHPACFVEQGLDCWLIAHYGDGRLKQFALHRFRRASLTDDPAVMPSQRALDTWLAEQRGFQFALDSSADVSLRIRVFDRALALRFRERPLSDDQLETPQPSGTSEFQATVADTVGLRRYLRSFGTDLEVVGPPTLRAEFRRMHAAGSVAYAQRKKRARGK